MKKTREQRKHRKMLDVVSQLAYADCTMERACEDNKVHVVDFIAWLDGDWIKKIKEEE